MLTRTSIISTGVKDPDPTEEDDVCLSDLYLVFRPSLPVCLCLSVCLSLSLSLTSLICQPLYPLVSVFSYVLDIYLVSFIF